MNTELKISGHLLGFARRLVSEGYMDEPAALRAVEQATQKGRTLLAWLIRENGVDPALLAAAASLQSEGAVHSHTRRALEAGAAQEEIYHALVLLVSTIGFPKVAAAISWADDVTRK